MQHIDPIRGGTAVVRGLLCTLAIFAAGTAHAQEQIWLEQDDAATGEGVIYTVKLSNPDGTDYGTATLHEFYRFPKSGSLAVSQDGTKLYQVSYTDGPTDPPVLYTYDVTTCQELPAKTVTGLNIAPTATFYGFSQLAVTPPGEPELLYAATNNSDGYSTNDLVATIDPATGATVAQGSTNTNISGGDWAFAPSGDLLTWSNAFGGTGRGPSRYAGAQRLTQDGGVLTGTKIITLNRFGGAFGILSNGRAILAENGSRNHPANQFTVFDASNFGMVGIFTPQLEDGSAYSLRGAQVGGADMAISFTVAATCDMDVDADGVPDGQDQCLGTPPGQIVDENGCSVQQLCAAQAPTNHGQYESCIVQLTQDWVKSGYLTQTDRKDIVTEAAQSDIGK